MKWIPVYTPLFDGNEKKYLQKCIDGRWISSEGYFVQKFEEEFAKWSGNKYAIAVSNGTAALETAMFSLNAKYVFIPNHTIISCALAVLRRGFAPLLYENIPLSTSAAESDNFPLLRCHLFGCFDRIVSPFLIDDASQYWKPFKVQNIACYSLFANKLITCGEGGVLVTNNRRFYERARLYRNLCHSKTRFVHNEKGYNFRISNLQAAVALAQLEQINKFIAIKQKIRDWYNKYLPDNVLFLSNVEIPWMFLIKLLKGDASKISKKLKQNGIDSRRFFYPISLQPIFKDIYSGFKTTLSYWEKFLYLPSGLNLTEKDISFICDTLKNV